MKTFFLLAFAFFLGRATAITTAEILGRDFRPSVEELRSIPFNDIESEVGIIEEPNPIELKVFEIYRRIISALRKHGTSNYMFMARDCEILFDAFVTVSDSEERKRIHLAPISRPLAAKSSATALRKLLSLNGTDLSSIIKKNQRVIWFDTGSRGRIFRNLLAALASLLEESSERKILYTNIYPLFMYSVGHSTKETVIPRILDVNSRSYLQLFFENNLFFDPIDDNLFQGLGIGSSLYEKSHWIVDYIEHAPKWTNRYEFISEDGDLFFETVNPCADRIDRKEHLKLQVKAVRHFLENKQWQIEGNHDACLDLLAKESGPIASGEGIQKGTNKNLL